MSAATIRVEHLSWAPARGADLLLHDTSFDLASGHVLGVVGPNGAGKTTLLRTLYRYHRPTTGRVMIDGNDIWQMSARAVSRKIAAVLQEQPSDFALTVGEIVALGRTPHRKGWAGSPGAQDQQIIDAALDRLDLHGLAARHLGNLSGGERQRVMVARALAQDPQVLILDEPTNHLDIRHQLEVLAMIKDLDLTIITSLHDLNLAAGLCDDILLLRGGRMMGCGAAEEVLSEAAVSSAFDIVARRERLMPSNTDHLTFHLTSERNS